MKLLIVDDEAHIRQMMRLTLETAGYEVDEASTGEEGLKQFGDGRQYDLVLLDQKMPGIDGLTTLQRLEERAPGVCVVMVTAFASIELAVGAMKLGATDFLRKPMTPEALRGAVAAALASAPRTPVRGAVAPADHLEPRIETLTLNGFRIDQSPEPIDPAAREHVFHITHFADGTTDPDGTEYTVIVEIDPEAVGRVARLTRRQLQPGGAFWRNQAQRLLSAFLWTEGKPPESGRLTVHDVSREDIDMAAVWELG
jgi:DNA-binding response OmpR family regulator